MHRVPGVGDFDFVDEHLHPARRLQDVHPLEGVLGMHGDGRRFLEPFVHGFEVDFGEAGECCAGAGEVVAEHEAGGCGAGTDFKRVFVGDEGSILGFDGFALREGEVFGVGVEEGSCGDVVLRVVGVFPDEEGGGCLGYEGAVEEQADEARSWERLHWAFSGEFEGKVFETLFDVSVDVPFVAYVFYVCDNSRWGGGWWRHVDGTADCYSYNTK